MAAKDRQIDSLMQAGERGDILLKSIQDRVRQLEAPKEARTEQGTGQQEEEKKDVQSDVQAKTGSVQAEQKENVQTAEVLDGKYEGPAGAFEQKVTV